MCLAKMVRLSLVKTYEVDLIEVGQRLLTRAHRTSYKLSTPTH